MTGKSEITAETNLPGFYVQSHRVFMSPVWATIVRVWGKMVLVKQSHNSLWCGSHDWNADATPKFVQWNTKVFTR